MTLRLFLAGAVHPGNVGARKLGKQSVKSQIEAVLALPEFDAGSTTGFRQTLKARVERLIDSVYDESSTALDEIATFISHQFELLFNTRY